MNANIFTLDVDDPDEKYVWDERLAILLDGAQREPTEQEIEFARQDVIRFRGERID